MRGYGGIWWDIGGYGANGARWDPRAHMGPSGRALHWFHIPPYPNPPISPHAILILYYMIYDILYKRYKIDCILSCVSHACVAPLLAL